MDSDFWTTRLAAAKRHHALHQHHHHQDRLGIEDFDVEDGFQPEFPCPYCYVELDIVSLCSHLEDKHSCESKVTTCPICSVKVERNMLSHMTLQHARLFKLQSLSKLRRVTIPNSQALSLFGLDLRDAHLQVLLSGGYRTTNPNVSNPAIDPLLSSLIFNLPASEAEENSKPEVTHDEDSSTKKLAPSHIWKSSFYASLGTGEREKMMREAAGRTCFVQELFLSTLLGD